MYIGAINDGGADAFHFPGLIDEVRIYNRALSPDEIKRLYRIGATLTLSHTRKNTLTDGLVGHWTFDGPDMSGDLALDASGQGNDGTLTPSAGGGPIRAAGKIGQALDFDDIEDYVDTNYAPNIDSSTGLSISAWVKTPASGVGDDLMSSLKEAGANDPKVTFSTGSGGCVESTDVNWAVADDDGTSISACASTVGDGEWHHLVGTLNRDTNLLSLYIDNVFKDDTDASAIGGIDLSGNAFYIGARNSRGADASHFPGLIDDVRIYNRALSADEVKRLYNMGR